MADLSNLENLERVEFSEGDLLFHEGDEDHSFFIIQEGNIEIFLNGTRGQEIVLAKLGPGQPVGEFALIVNKPRSATARAMSSGYAIKISESAYSSLIKELPEWAHYLIKSLIERLRTTDEMLRTNQTRDEITIKTQS